MKKSVFPLSLLLMCAVAGAQAERSGGELYEGKCKACHISGVANAPKFGDKEAWAPRAALGVDTLVATVKTGKNAMPPMGTCLDCTDAELKSAVEHMLSAAQ